jgi:hypothetical protein
MEPKCQKNKTITLLHNKEIQKERSITMEPKCQKNKTITLFHNKEIQKERSVTMEPKCQQNQLLHCSIKIIHDFPTWK